MEWAQAVSRKKTKGKESEWLQPPGGQRALRILLLSIGFIFPAQWEELTTSVITSSFYTPAQPTRYASDTRQGSGLRHLILLTK